MSKKDDQKDDKYDISIKEFYAATDELFDELVGKLLTFMEACGFCEDEDDSNYTAKSGAIRKTIKSTVREIQNRIKDEFPSPENLGF